MQHDENPSNGTLQAFGGPLSKSEVVAKVEEIGRLAKDATSRAIRDNALAMAKDPRATASILMNGDPDPTTDALTDECNAHYPL
jgi:hypothetical protein